MKTIKLQPTENAVVDVRVVGDSVGGLGETLVGDGVGGSAELLTDKCSRQVCAGPPLILLETNQELDLDRWSSEHSSLVEVVVQSHHFLFVK